MGKRTAKRARLKYIEMDPIKVEGKYYRGRISTFNPSTGYGFVESRNGTQIFFYADQVRLEGPYTKRACIRPGSVVGFDVGWTDRGIRICKMKIVHPPEERG